jgi:hypothetical protein
LIICGADIEQVGDCKFFIMSPSVKLIYKDKTYQTPIVNEGGFSPKWYHTFDIKVDSLEDEILIKIITN